MFRCMWCLELTVALKNTEQTQLGLCEECYEKFKTEQLEDSMEEQPERVSSRI